jgi:hypothetical protein
MEWFTTFKLPRMKDKNLTQTCFSPIMRLHKFSSKAAMDTHMHLPTKRETQKGICEHQEYTVDAQGS